MKYVNSTVNFMPSVYLIYLPTFILQETATSMELVVLNNAHPILAKVRTKTQPEPLRNTIIKNWQSMLYIQLHVHVLAIIMLLD